MKKCKKYSLLIYKHIDGIITVKEQKELENHIESCEKCNEEFKLITALKKELSEDTNVPLPDNFNTVLHRKLVEYNMAKPTPVPLHKRLFVNLGATLCLALGITIFAVNYNTAVAIKPKLILPQKNINNEIIISYLINRGIDREIIDYLIENDLMYETKDNHNIVFIGKDSNNIPRYAFIRASNKTRFMHDASGSEKEFSFRLLSDVYNDTLHIFESVIDLLSYATILKNNNKNYKKENLIALSGVYQSSKQYKVPIAITSFLDKNKYINKIFLHLDNDPVGRNAIENLKTNLQENYEVIDGKPFQGKDWNDYLLIILNKHLKER